VTDGTPPVTVDSRVSDGCDACDGFLQSFYKPLSPPCPVGNPSPGGGVSLGEHSPYPSYLSYPSSVRGSGVTASAPSVTEALSKDPVAVGDWVWLLSEDGVQQNGLPYRCQAIEQALDGPWYARFVGSKTGWPLAQCVRADPPATVRHLPCALCGGTERWEHAGVLRCATCWPLEHGRTHTRGDIASSGPGTTSGDPPYMTDEA
jgi:hypothetical protein